jgi:hypothetical protein
MRNNARISTGKEAYKNNDYASSLTFWQQAVKRQRKSAGVKIMKE